MGARLVTVFGGSGFLGRHLVQRLAANGDHVRVAVRDSEAAQFLKVMGGVGQITPMTANIANDSQVAAAVRGADAVVNLVGILSESWRQTFKRIHTEGAANVARAASEAGAKRLVQISAIGADKDSRAKYARAKAAGEEAAKAAFADAAIVRPSVMFGPEDKFFNMFAGFALVSPVLPLFGVNVYSDGGTKFQPVYVGDVADAIMKILSDAGCAGKTYELGGPTVYSYKQVMELLLKQIGRRRLLVPAPFLLARFWAWFLEKAPNPLLTRDQLRLLEKDNVAGEKAMTFKDLGLTPMAAEAVLPAYLQRFRPQTQQRARQII